jgi:hypothetical protein
LHLGEQAAVDMCQSGTNLPKKHESLANLYC